jgi:alkylation response protein AidB-like acyl-CoA dehydrogenase
MSFVERARALAPLLAAHADAHARTRGLAPEVVAALRDGGFLQLLLPRALGGLAVEPAEYVATLEQLAVADAASAWVVMTASTSTLLAAYFERATAETIWAAGGPAPLLAGVFAPGGKAIADGDAVRLDGRWPYASGCRHAAWIAVGAILDGRHVVCALPIDAPGVRIEDNWDTVGLGGTGSHDLIVAGAVVPRSHVTSVFERAPWSDEPLARAPLFGLLALGIGGVGLGIARGALEHVGAILATPRGEPPASTILASYATLVARQRAARSWALEVATAAGDAARAGSIAPAVRGELRLAAAHAARESAAIVREAFHLGGGASIRSGSRLGRALGDAEVVLTHRMVADRILPAAARALLGVGAVPPDL